MKKNKLVNKQNHDYLVSHNVLEDPNFSAAKNQSIIDGTIRKYEENRIAKMRIWDAKLRDRSDMVASYLKHVDQKGSIDPEKYFGRKEMARLRGEEISDVLRNKVNMFKGVKYKHDTTLV